MSLKVLLLTILFLWSFAADETCATRPPHEAVPTVPTNLFSALVSPGSGGYFFYDNVIRRYNDLALLHRVGNETRNDHDDMQHDDRDGHNSSSYSSTPSVSELIEMQSRRLRSRLRRIRHIRQNIETNIGSHGSPRPSRPSPDTTPFFYYGTPVHRSCHLAACQHPPGTNDSVWEHFSRQNMLLYFSLPRLHRHRGREEKVKSASLKIFIKPMTGSSLTSNNREEVPDLLISLYQFIRPLSMRNRHRVIYRRQLLDVEMIPSSGNVWVNFNIERAVSTWMSRPRRNWGLEVVIKDVNETLVNARDFVVFPVCPKEQNQLVSTCRDDNGERVYPLPWRVSNDELRRNEPYVDISIRNSIQERELIHRQILMQKQISEEGSMPIRSRRSLTLTDILAGKHSLPLKDQRG